MPTNDTDLVADMTTREPRVPTVDYNLSLYDLTDLFFSYFIYHNDDCALSFNEWQYVQDLANNTWNLSPIQKTLSRFAILRRIEACNLSSRPFIGNVEVEPHKPNTSLGYLSMLLRYVALPFKTVTSEKELVRVNFDRKLLESVIYDIEEQEQLRIQRSENPNIFSNFAISDDTSDAFNSLLTRSKCMQATAERSASDVVKNGFAAFLHTDPKWETEPIDALDLVFEPQAYWDTRTWSNFFIVRKMTAQEAVTHIREKTPFWNTNALRWALESSAAHRSIFRVRYNQAPYSQLGVDNTPLCGENFMVKSFYADKANRILNLQGYYGNLLVVEGYYKNTDGKIQKVIFFPSADFYNVPIEKRTNKLSMDKIKELGLEGANVLFSRTLDKKSIWDIISVIPFNRTEPTLERQRAYGHELFNTVEMLMRTDTSILNLVALMGVIFVKNRNEGTSPQNIQDLNIKMTGAVQDLGDREILDQPFTHDLNAMLSVRSMLVQHLMAKAYLSGLDNAEAVGQGRGADFAKFRLVRDGRVHKHDIEAFGKGQEELYSKVLRSVLEEMNEDESAQDRMVKTLFTYPLLKEFGYEKELFEYDKDDILEDNALPYWMSVSALRNGASNMGPAEVVLYNEIQNMVGGYLSKPQVDALVRKLMKSILGPQDAMDILGDPKDALQTDQDQIHEAQIENAAIVGSVSNSTLNFQPIGIRESKDDPVAHLKFAHNPLCLDIIKRLDESNVAPSEMDGLTEEQLDTRVNLILRLAAVTTHSSLHMQQLEFFGDKNAEVNALKEETNNIIQSAEGLLNNLQINLRALQARRADTMLRLQNLSPENEAIKAEAQADMMKVQAEMRRDQDKLMLANKIADQNMQQHRDKQLTAARDRAQRDRQAMMANRSKDMDAQNKMFNRDRETAINMRNKRVESDFDLGLRARDANNDLVIRNRESRAATAMKDRETEANIQNKRRETDVKIEAKKKEADAKVKSMNGASK